MNGVHDMGGLQCFGPVKLEANEPLFHHGWERRALGLTLAMGATGSWTLDQARAARESLPPATYLGSSYYRIWIEALGNLMVERGLVTQEELRSGRALTPPAKVPRVLAAEAVPATLARGAPTEREPRAPARFAAGDRVRARDWNPPTHTRLPRYARGKQGTIVAVRGCHLFADANALGRPDAHWLYTVRFDATELWGPHTTASSVHVDCWEPYLEAV
jgi:nitrile hydratase beta subunit